MRLFEEFLQRKTGEEVRLAFKLAWLFTWILWVAHLVCCIWYAIGVRGPSDTGRRWIDDSGYMQAGQHVPFPECTLAYQYTTSFHWAAGQIALGNFDQMPTNSL